MLESWVTVDPRTNLGYVGCFYAGWIAVINGRTHAVTTRATFATSPADMVINPATDTGYALDEVGNFSIPGTVSVLSLLATSR